jgi:hypothetical protein
MAMADEVRAQISDQELRDLEAELEQARQRIAELESLDYERIIQQPLRARIAELEQERGRWCCKWQTIAEQQGAVATIQHIIAGLEQMLQQMARDQVGIEANQETNTR